MNRRLRRLVGVLSLASCHRPAVEPVRIVVDAGAGTALASSIERVPPRPEGGCPAMRDGAANDVGTVHHAIVQGNETWTAEGSPHRLPEGLRIVDGASVTLVPCALVLAARGTAIRVERGGALFAMGESAQRRVRFDADSASPVSAGAWNGIVFDRDARATSRLQYALVEHGGAHGAALDVALADFDVAHLVVNESLARGVWLRAGGSFAHGADMLEIRATRASEANEGGMPLVVEDANAIGALPPLVLTDNARDEIAIVPVAHETTVRDSQQWRAGSYALADDHTLAIEGGAAATQLTLESGVRLALGAHDDIVVGAASSASLVLAGSDANPVVLGGASAQWQGIRYGTHADLEHCAVRDVIVRNANGIALDAPGCTPAGIDRALVVIEGTTGNAFIASLRVESIAPSVAVIAHVDRAPAASALTNDTRLFAGNSCVETAFIRSNGRCPHRAICTTQSATATIHAGIPARSSPRPMQMQR